MRVVSTDPPSSAGLPQVLGGHHASKGIEARLHYTSGPYSWGGGIFSSPLRAKNYDGVGVNDRKKVFFPLFFWEMTGKNINFPVFPKTAEFFSVFQIQQK